MANEPTDWFERTGQVTMRRRQIIDVTRQLISDLRALARDPVMTEREQTNLAAAAERWEAILTMMERPQS